VILEAIDVTHDEFLMNGVSVQMKLATLLLMNEALPRKGILRSSVIHFQCKCFPLDRPP